MSDNTLYVLRDPAGNIYGPATIATLRVWYQQGRIVGTMQIAPQGSAVWLPLTGHPGMADLFVGGGAVSVAPVPAGASSSGGTSAVPSAAASGGAEAKGGTGNDAAIDHARRAVGGFFRELYHLSPAAFWGGVLGVAGIVMCCGCGAILGVMGAVLGVLALDKGTGEVPKVIDPKVKKGAMVAIGLGLISLGTNCVGLTVLQFLHGRGWFGL